MVVTLVAPVLTAKRRATLLRIFTMKAVSMSSVAPGVRAKIDPPTVSTASANCAKGAYT